MRRIFRYMGDVSIEHGGYFYCLDTWRDGYVDAVRVTPCSDAGGPDNCFWVERITVLLPIGKGDQKKWCEVMDSYGISLEDFRKLKPAVKKATLVDACISYGLYDPAESMHTPWSQMIRIGPEDKFYNGREGEFKPAVILRAGSSLRNYARKQCDDL